MQKKTKAKKTDQKVQKKNKSKFLLIFVCIFVSIVLVFGIVFGTIAIIKSRNSVASFGGVAMNGEVANYFASSYKSDYMSLLSRAGVKGVEDSPGFWNSTSETGEKYIDLLEKGAKEYVKQIIVLNYLYNRYSSLSSADKDIIKTAIDGTLRSHGGSVEAFNALVSDYGFDYSSYSDAVEMIYKAASCEALICGTGGSKLKSSTDSDIIEFRNSYLEKYAHVKLLFISTERAFVLDKDGNRMSDGEGGYQTRELEEDEAAARLAEIETIRSAILAIGTDGVQMGPDMFENYLYSDLYSGMLETRDKGYYFHKSSSAAQSFDNQDIVSRSLEMKVGEFGEVIVDGGVCFIYKLATDPADLSTSGLESFFSDFYEDLSDEFLSSQVSKLTPSVKVKDDFDLIDFNLLPYNYAIVPSFEG